MSESPSNPNGAIRNLKKGEKIPCDGHIYRDADGQLWFAMTYPIVKQAHHAWLLSVIEPVEKKEPK